jgi:hypothetical protein
VSELVVDCYNGEVEIRPVAADVVAVVEADRVVLTAADAERVDRHRVSSDLRTRMRAAVGDNSAYLAIGAPTNAQNLAQIRRLTRQMNALIRATVGADLLVDSTDV